MNVDKIIMSVEDDKNNSNETIELVNQYSDIFDGIGQFPDEYSFTLHPNAEPVIYPPRGMPMALCDKVKVNTHTRYQNSTTFPDSSRFFPNDSHNQKSRHVHIDRQTDRQIPLFDITVYKIII